jgi:hypothetical protein
LGHGNPTSHYLIFYIVKKHGGLEKFDISWVPTLEPLLYITEIMYNVGRYGHKDIPVVLQPDSGWWDCFTFGARIVQSV